jgi:hypothetical protein
MIAVFIIFWFGDSNTITNGMSIQERIVASLLTMFEMAMTWWFADRQVSKKDK